MVLRDEPCARTVPDSLLKAVSWMEKVAEFKLELRATGGRLAWAAKDKIVEVLFASQLLCESMLGLSWSRSGPR